MSEATTIQETPVQQHATTRFFPQKPTTLAKSGLRKNELEGLLLKFFLNRTTATGHQAAEQVCLPYRIVLEGLNELRAQRFLALREAAAMDDYIYELTADGLSRTRQHLESSTYFGAAPVTLADYCESVAAQSLRNYRVKAERLREALDGLLYDSVLLTQVGQAINTGRGLFLYGPPGNGKTTVAERMMAACDESIWVPRTITVTGELIRVFDPNYHTAVELEETAPLMEQPHDRRWVKVRRPTVVVGGELSLEHLELSRSAVTGMHEAPVQVKSNGGALVVDDFGRQRVASVDLLNRWIVPLEKRFDHLTLRSGRQICVPFDQLLVFATNLAPSNVADEAFFRRMPFKVEMHSPTADQFVHLLKDVCQQRNVAYQDAAVEHLVEAHYRAKNRAFRFCHARDLMDQVESYCDFQETPAELNEATADIAAHNYFAGL